MWGNDSPNGMHTPHNWLAQGHRSSRRQKEAILADRERSPRERQMKSQKKSQREIKKILEFGGLHERGHSSTKSNGLWMKIFKWNFKHTHSLLNRIWFGLSWRSRWRLNLRIRKGSWNFEKEREQLKKNHLSQKSSRHIGRKYLLSNVFFETAQERQSVPNRKIVSREIV